MFIVVFFTSTIACAAYNANHSSVITGVFVYTDTDDIYITLKNKPEAKCNNTYFVISSSVPEVRRQMLLSRLLLAFASKETTNIGFDAQEGACVSGYVRVHRVG